MISNLVLTIIGPDRPGVVRAISDIVAQHEGNWLESRMSHLAGQFAGILHVAVPAHRAADLAGDLAALPSLRIVVATGEDDMGGAASVVDLELVGNDRPGIIRDVARTIARHGINVDDLDTECMEAPMSGGTLFRANARLRLPETADIEQLTLDLEQIANDLMVEVSIVPASKT